MEQIIVFLYDTEHCQHEADDPQKAVLFFHPNWVSEQQRLALCGQLMGATHFCSSMFSAPNVLTLQSGKFVLKKLGRYVLSVGSDQSLPEWILKERFRTLQALITFYHKDIGAILAAADNDHESFIKQIGQIFDQYIPVLQTVVNSVGSVPSIQYTNGTSPVFLEALQLLEACSTHKGVAGGAVLHNSRIVVSQLDADTNLLVAVTDPYRIKVSGQSITVPFHLPVGVQLFKIFVKNSFLTGLKSSNETQKPKRDKAKIFTVLEEEEETTGTQPSRESGYLKLKHRRNSKYKSDILKERSKNFKANPNISVCSTPTVEKKLIHEDVLSICSGKVDTKLPEVTVPDLVQDVLKTKSSKTPQYKSLRRFSMDDQMVDLTHKAFPIPLRYYSFGLPKICKQETKKGKGIHRRHYKTLTDPVNPLLREDGLSVSRGLYNKCLDDHYKDYLAANKTIDSQEQFLKNYKIEKKPEPVIEVKAPEPEKKIDQKLFRRSLTLALKPITVDNDTTSAPKVKQLQTPSTPLLSKLSLLALEEQPCEVKVELPPPSCVRRREERPKLEEAPSKKDTDQDTSLVSCSLFVCGHNNMTLTLILEEGVEQNPDLVFLLWEAATSNLDRVESAWNKSMDHVSQISGSSSYSFLSLDPSWGTIRKHGPWNNEELRIVGSLHQDLVHSKNITELIVRSEDAVVYGYRCGNIETFYQQAGSSSIGLPTPADLMGVVTLKAKRRLERDHGIVLL